MSCARNMGLAKGETPLLTESQEYSENGKAVYVGKWDMEARQGERVAWSVLKWQR